MPEKKAIFPPGMQNALTCLLRIRFTSQCQWRARSFHCAVCEMMLWAIARSFCS